MEIQEKNVSHVQDKKGMKANRYEPCENFAPEFKTSPFGSREREGKPAQHFSFTSLEEFQSLKFARSKC
ncbi:hypothetical protein ACFXTN_018942 [Malus domestica]